MKKHLSTFVSIEYVSMETVLPGINSRFDMMQNSMLSSFNNLKEGHRMFDNHLQRLRLHASHNTTIQSKIVAIHKHQLNWNFEEQRAPESTTTVFN